MNPELNNDQKSFIKDMTKTEGWKLAEALNKRIVIDLRTLATQQKLTPDERLWYCGQAMGLEQAIENIKRIVEKEPEDLANLDEPHAF